MTVVILIEAAIAEALAQQPKLPQVVSDVLAYVRYGASRLSTDIEISVSADGGSPCGWTGVLLAGGQ